MQFLFNLVSCYDLICMRPNGFTPFSAVLFYRLGILDLDAHRQESLAGPTLHSPDLLLQHGLLLQLLPSHPLLLLLLLLLKLLLPHQPLQCQQPGIIRIIMWPQPADAA